MHKERCRRNDSRALRSQCEGISEVVRLPQVPALLMSKFSAWGIKLV